MHGITDKARGARPDEARRHLFTAEPVTAANPHLTRFLERPWGQAHGFTRSRSSCSRKGGRLAISQVDSTGLYPRRVRYDMLVHAWPRCPDHAASRSSASRAARAALACTSSSAAKYCLSV